MQNIDESGAFEVKMGTKVSKYPIDRYKGAKGRRDMISILSANPLVTKTHYHKELNYFYYSKVAVERGLDIMVRYNFLIAVWNTDSKGKILSKEYELRILQLGNEFYNDLVTKYELHGDLRKKLIMVSCSDEKYQKLSFEVAGDAPHLKDKELFNDIFEKYQEFKSFIPLVIANHLSEEDVAEKLGVSSKSQPESYPQTQVMKSNKQLFDVPKVIEDEPRKKENVLSFDDSAEDNDESNGETEIDFEPKSKKSSKVSKKDPPVDPPVGPKFTQKKVDDFISSDDDFMKFD